MKIWIKCFGGLILNQIIVVLSCCNTTMAQAVTNSPSVPAQSNTLAIYLLVGEQKSKLEDNVLESRPVLADGDFVSFNLNSQKFVIKAEAAKRLCRKLQEKGSVSVPEWFEWSATPFVLEALGDRIYLGMFSSYTSSVGYFGKPVVRSSTVFNPLTSTNDVEFDIGFNGYAAHMRPVLDPRNDKRIVGAVEKLFKKTGTSTGNQSNSKSKGQTADPTER